MTGWNLPPGCTTADIDRAAGVDEPIIVGFTGTQLGMTGQQLEAFRLKLIELACTEFHHGDCIGADAQAWEIARSLELRTICHPPKREIKRANTYPNDETRAPHDYLVRNRHIVEESDFLVACPAQMTEQLRSGTWATIREARRQGKVVYVILPNGTEVTYWQAKR